MESNTKRRMNRETVLEGNEEERRRRRCTLRSNGIGLRAGGRGGVKNSRVQRSEILKKKQEGAKQSRQRRIAQKYGDGSAIDSWDIVSKP